MGTNALEKLSQIELARYAVDVLRRIVLHYGIWFNEVVHQLGLEEAIRLEEKVSGSFFPIAPSHGEMPCPENKRESRAAGLSLQVGGTGRIRGICQDDRF